MKVFSFAYSRVPLCSLLFAAALAFAPNARSFPALIVTPPAITNSYNGVITLNITGLTNNQQVQVKRFYDVNGNGAIDAGKDFMVQSFKFTDGTNRRRAKPQCAGR